MQKKKPTKPAAKKVRKGTQKRGDATRKAVAAGVVQKKTENQIAKEAGISRTRVTKIKAEPQFSLVIADLLKPLAKEFNEGFKVYITGMVELMAKGKLDSTRLAAMDRFAKLLETTQPKGANLFMGITVEALEKMVKGE